MTPMRLEPAALQSRVKHSTTGTLRSLPSGLGGDVIKRKLLTDDGRTDNGHPMITIANLEPMAQVSHKVSR